MVEELRKSLKQKYDAFVSSFGQLNKSRNKRVFLKDVYGFKVLSSLEKKIDGQFFEADVLTKPVGQQEPYTTSFSVEALSYCLGTYGRVDIDFIANTVDMDRESVIQELEGLIYLNPSSREWEESSKYLSGNVYEKYIVAKGLCASNDETELHHLQNSLKAIENVQVEKIPFSLLSLNLGARWIPVEFYKNFAQWVMETKTTPDIVYFISTDEYKIAYTQPSSRVVQEFKVWSSMSNRSLHASDLLEHALQNTAPIFTYTIGDQKYKDNEATQLAAEKIEKLRTKFAEWLQLLPDEDKDTLVDLYNNTYNCYRLRKYDGSLLRLPDIDMEGLLAKFDIKEIRPGQKDVVWRIIQDKGAIVDHQVGAGKTLCMVIAAHEMKRMGIIKKPCILALKGNIQQVATTYQIAYPQAKILFPSEKDFEKKNRQRLFYEMKNNDWDCIIMTHDQFGKIPQDPDIQKEFIQEEIDNLEKNLNDLKFMDWSITRAMRKGLEQRKSTLEVKLREFNRKVAEQQDKELSFSEIHIDHLFIDEAHKFKNLFFTTRHDRVAGIGNQQGSQKALNMLFAIRTLQKRVGRDLQATFLSGTPISNSLTEMYLLFRYLIPGELEKQNLLNFDSWAAVFAKKTTDFEFSVTNQIIAKERFRYFVNVPELALMYNMIADYRTNSDLNIDKPEMAEELVAIDATEDQAAFIENLIKFAETGDATLIGRRELSDNEKNAKMLIATNYAKKMSTDMRLIDQFKYGDHPGNKVSIMCRNIVKFYEDYKDDRGTQIVFCDLGTPNSDKVKQYNYATFQNDLVPKFTVYQAVKDKLVQEYLIPESEIAFIHDYNEKTRPGLFKQMNNGDIRILLGSTDKLGTGVNIQQRVVAMHHMDIPWKPSELEQRNGRGPRQGNWLAKLKQDNQVFSYIYAVKQSLDTYKFTLLKNKQTFISQMKRNELQVRTVDEGAFDEENGMNFSEYIAVLSGDTTLLEKAKIDKKITMLENLRVSHYREQANSKQSLKNKEVRIVDVREYYNIVKRDYDLYDSQVTKDESGVKNNSIDIFALRDTLAQLEEQRKQREIEDAQEPEVDENGKKIKKEKKEPVKDKPLVVGEYLIALHRDWRPKIGGIKEHIGTLYGFNIFIERTADSKDYMALGGSNINNTNKIYTQHPDGGVHYMYNHGNVSMDSPRQAARNPLGSLDRIAKMYNDYSQELKQLEFDINGLKTMKERPFEREEELNNLYEEAKRLTSEINASLIKDKAH